jgi:hypothetical protein
MIKTKKKLIPKHLDNFNVLKPMYKASDYRCLKPENNKVNLVFEYN